MRYLAVLHTRLLGLDEVIYHLAADGRGAVHPNVAAARNDHESFGRRQAGLLRHHHQLLFSVSVDQRLFDGFGIIGCYGHMSLRFFFLFHMGDARFAPADGLRMP